MGGSGDSWSGLAQTAGVGAALSFVICGLLILTKRWHGWLSFDHRLGPQKFHEHDVPRVGGVGVGLAFVLIWPLVPDAARGMWGIIGIAAVAPFAAGLTEDLTRKVGVKVRLLATMAGGVIFALLSGYTMHKVNLPGVDWLLSYWLIALAFTGFAVGGVANAVNIIDGFNGLASGSLIIMFATFAWVASRVGDPLVFSLAIVFIGLTVGFFVLNFPFGWIFLGDGGAYFLGFLLAILGVLLPMRNEAVSAWTAILICGYPVIETLASMRRKSQREGHSVGLPDRIHFHMLVHRRFGRSLFPHASQRRFRNPAASVVTWCIPAMTSVFVMIGYDNVVLCAIFFFLTWFIYVQIYRTLSLNA